LYSNIYTDAESLKEKPLLLALQAYYTRVDLCDAHKADTQLMQGDSYLQGRWSPALQGSKEECNVPLVWKWQM